MPSEHSRMYSKTHTGQTRTGCTQNAVVGSPRIYSEDDPVLRMGSSTQNGIEHSEYDPITWNELRTEQKELESPRMLSEWIKIAQNAFRMDRKR
jgi:hypothetical protein